MHTPFKPVEVGRWVRGRVETQRCPRQGPCDYKVWYEVFNNPELTTLSLMDSAVYQAKPQVVALRGVLEAVGLGNDCKRLPNYYGIEFGGSWLAATNYDSWIYDEIGGDSWVPRVGRNLPIDCHWRVDGGGRSTRFYFDN